VSEENKAVVRRAFDAVSEGDLVVTDEITASDFVRHDLASMFEEVRGVEAVRQFIVALRAAFPDLQLTVEDIIAEGDKVMVRFTGRGTHKGVFLGIPPTGKAVIWAGINIYRLAGGKVAETWQLSDALGLLRQLGAIRR
jgi:steroid delta-isomerase-like uncharacterized protein